MLRQCLLRLRSCSPALSRISSARGTAHASVARYHAYPHRTHAVCDTTHVADSRIAPLLFSLSSSPVRRRHTASAPTSMANSRSKHGSTVACAPAFTSVGTSASYTPEPSVSRTAKALAAAIVAAAITAASMLTASSIALADSTPTKASTPDPLPHPVPTPTPAPETAVVPVHAALLSRYSVADAVEKVLPSVVNIRRVVSRPRLHMFFSAGSEAVEVACGSGFFISSDGLLLTNSHVVTTGDDAVDADSTLHITTSTGESYLGRVVASDPTSDVAIVKINTDKPTPAATLGLSTSVRAGDFIIAVGSPLTLSNSCSFGIVSTMHRDLSSVHAQTSGGLTYMQLDLAINQGSSGGPVVTLDGNVVGICSMKIGGDAEGIAFAIPIRYAQRVATDLLTHGFVRRPYVGLTLISVTPALFEDIRQDTSYRPPRWLETEIRHTNSAKSVGLMVHHVTKNGPGHAAGLKAGDVIVTVDGARTMSTSEFLAALSSHVLKDCTLTVRRATSGRVDEVIIRPEVLQQSNDSEAR